MRAVVRSRAKGDEWAALGCEVSVASIDDTAAMTEAFRDVDGVFLLTPTTTLNLAFRIPNEMLRRSWQPSKQAVPQKLSFCQPWEPRSPN